MSQESQAPLGDPVKLERPVYRRLLVKLSGEMLMGEGHFGVDPAMMEGIALQVVKEVHALGCRDCRRCRRRQHHPRG